VSDGSFVVANEFSAVLVRLDDSGRSPRLHVTHRVSGREIYLDALQLEALISLRPEDLWELLDPSDLG
jgi:hypothetical protein